MGLIIDLFAGGGGASEGIRMALGRDPDVAVNHDPLAVAMHKANHPGTLHVCQDIWSCPPNWATRGKPVALLWGSPDCTHHSKAKGGPPNRDEKRRDLAWVIVKWAREVRPAVIILENVEEFTSWGPCDKDGIPIKSQAGASFRSFKATLRRLGYAVQHRELRACDYGAPTIRKRLFLIARRDGRPIVWPEATHGPSKPLPYRTAAQCIDFSLPCPSIFERARPLAENTLHRIAEGIERYVIQTASPYIVGLDNAGARSAKWAVDQPLSTVITKAKHGLVTPFLAGAGGPVYAGKPVAMSKPFGTLMTENHQAVIAPVLVTNTSGHAPVSLDAPVPTLTTGQQQLLVAAHLAKHYTGVVGQELAQPIGTITTVDHHSVVVASIQKFYGTGVGSGADEPLHTLTAGGPNGDGRKHGLMTSHLVKLRGTCKHGQPMDEPAPTITSGGTHVGEVRACLMKYYGEGGQHQSPAEPMHTIPTKDRMAVVEARPSGNHAAEVRALLRWHRQGKLAKAWARWGLDDFDGLCADAFAGEVVLDGEVYSIADIGMRMLQPRELYLAQGFQPSYIIGDDPAQGLALTKAEQVRMCGNSVSPPIAAALIRANYAGALREERDLPLIPREVV